MHGFASKEMTVWVEDISTGVTMLMALCQACKRGAGEAEIPGNLSTLQLSLAICGGYKQYCVFLQVWFLTANQILWLRFYYCLRVPQGHVKIWSSNIYPCVVGYVLGISWVLRLVHWQSWRWLVQRLVWGSKRGMFLLCSCLTEICEILFRKDEHLVGM